MANGLQKTPDPLNVNLAEFMMKTFRGTTEEGMITPCAPQVFPSVNPIGLVLQMMEVVPWKAEESKITKLVRPPGFTLRPV